MRRDLFQYIEMISPPISARSFEQHPSFTVFNACDVIKIDLIVKQNGGRLSFAFNTSQTKEVIKN